MASDHDSTNNLVLTPTRPARTDLVASVVEQLQERILSGEQPIGSALQSEADLAQRFGVSRPVVREALRSLSVKGLISIAHGRRAEVLPVDSESFVRTVEMFLRRTKSPLLGLTEVRRVIEPEIAAFAAERASQSDIEALEDESRKLAAATDRQVSVEADLAFHTRLAASTLNPVFVLIMQTISGLMKQSVKVTYARCGGSVHDPILAAIKDRDPDRARNAMTHHIDRTEVFLEEG